MTQPDIWHDLAAELDLWSRGSIRLWLRDDDAVAPSPALDRLAGLSERFALPVLLAVIPMLAEPALARSLKATPSLLPCQHGCWHRNHAPPGGRKSEFGAEREIDAVRAEIILARQRLGDLLGSALLPVFVPPWNRIDRDLAAALPALGFSGLSCFRGFTLGEASGPVLANTDIDIMDWHGGRIGRIVEALATELIAHLAARRLQGGARPCTLGLLLHHRDHDATAWGALDALLARLCVHPAVSPSDPHSIFMAPSAPELRRTPLDASRDRQARAWIGQPGALWSHSLSRCVRPLHEVVWPYPEDAAAMPFNVVELPGVERTPRHPHAPRVLIYSHDTFGLGHIRRCRAIANSLVASYPHISVIIVSGSSVISSFQFGDGVDYVRIPGVEKHSDGRYSPHHLNLDLNETIRIRTDLIKQLALSFDPDVFIVDKEPIGLRGELVPALDILRRRGARIVLGVRDVLDEPETLHEEWRNSGALDALTQIYDDIFVYGLENVYQPLAGLPNQHLFADKIRYTGYLKRAVPSPMPPNRHPRITKGPFILVTPGGGGDGAGVIDWVISAYETDPTIALPALIVFGPFMSRERRKEFTERIARLPKLESLGFEPRLELLMNRAHCVVAMGGYNTFCEILSFDKPALIVPRVKPRLEQAIRANRADDLGLISVLHDPSQNGEGERDPLVMAAALHALPKRMPPSQAFVPSLLDGLPAISRALADDLAPPVRGRMRAQNTAVVS